MVAVKLEKRIPRRKRLRGLERNRRRWRMMMLSNKLSGMAIVAPINLKMMAQRFLFIGFGLNTDEIVTLLLV